MTREKKKKRTRYVLMSFDAIFDRNFFDVGLNYVGGSCRSEDLKGKKNHFR